MEFVFEGDALGICYWAITAAWLLECVVFRSRRYGQREPQDRSFWLIILAAVFALVLNGTLHHFEITRVTPSLETPIRWVALLLYSLGVALRYWAVWALGPWFSRHLQAAPEQELISRGPYRVLRHPLYCGLFLALTGTAALMVSWSGTLVGSLAVALAIRERMQREEEALEECFGTRYVEWSSRRYRFIPFLY